MSDVISSTDPGRPMSFGGWTAGDSGERVGAKGQVRITTPGAGAWTPPPGVTEVYVECIGGGGGGCSGEGLLNGVGGGGGAYAAALFPTVPGTPIPYTVGSGGAGATMGDGSESGTLTDWNVASIVAQYGLGTGPGATPGTGGSADLSVGTVKYSGGDGGASPSGAVGGAGGGSAGRAGPGATPTAGAGGLGQKPGGNGADAATNSSLAGAAGIGGGGGGGQGTGAYTDPSSGGGGMIIISWGYVP